MPTPAEPVPHVTAWPRFTTAQTMPPTKLGYEYCLHFAAMWRLPGVHFTLVVFTGQPGTVSAVADTGSWSRALMSSSGLALGREYTVQRETSSEWHEAIGANLTTARMMQLATSKSNAIREAIGARTDCPLGVLAALAHDHKAGVRASVAANSTTARAILEHLMGDRDVTVVKAIARNDATPHDLLQRLAQHRKEDVRAVAAGAMRGGPPSVRPSPARPRMDGTLAPRPIPPVRVDQDIQAPAPTVFFPVGRTEPMKP